jgi:predicted negative regulator of RcsB-dependent stress response
MAPVQSSGGATAGGADKASLEIEMQNSLGATPELSTIPPSEHRSLDNLKEDAQELGNKWSRVVLLLAFGVACLGAGLWISQQHNQNQQHIAAYQQHIAAFEAAQQQHNATLAATTVQHNATMHKCQQHIAALEATQAELAAAQQQHSAELAAAAQQHNAELAAAAQQHNAELEAARQS